MCTLPITTRRGPPSPKAPARRAQAGVGLVELLIGATVLVVALLGFTSSTVAQHHHAQTQRVRSAMLRSAGEFLERLRSDEDWAGLYDRLRYLQAGMATGAESSHVLTDGRAAHSPEVYFEGFRGMPGLTVLVDVPFGTDVQTGENVLREDLDLPFYMLPADLDGNGVIDDAPHDEDHVFLPVSTTFKWERPGTGGHEQFTVVTWLTGER